MQRRDILRIGGLGLCGVGALNLIQAQAASSVKNAKAKQLVVCWMGGGPPHTDMFDVKPEASEDYRGIFSAIDSKVPGLQVGELLPEMAKRADKYTVIRSVTTMNKPGDHAQAPLYWLTGNPRLTAGSDNFERPTPVPSGVIR